MAEPLEAQSVVAAHHRQTEFRESSTVEVGLGGGAEGEGASVDPDQNRERVPGPARRPYVDRQDVLVPGLPAGRARELGRLRGDRAESEARADAAPPARRPGRPETQGAERRLRVWDAEHRRDGGGPPGRLSPYRSGPRREHNHRCSPLVSPADTAPGPHPADGTAPGANTGFGAMDAAGGEWPQGAGRIQATRSGGGGVGSDTASPQGERVHPSWCVRVEDRSVRTAQYVLVLVAAASTLPALVIGRPTGVFRISLLAATPVSVPSSRATKRRPTRGPPWSWERTC